ncbi:hypothetical protein [Anaerotruncus colihominis]|uniref:hypothetical protein n=1 Tax=Anaerotruncus colihominis TaxID=169435 RepID=UPI0002E75836|nr:hypothetical protein [Anaerotruncus colihominis]UWN75649.1 hypothetical protein NQ528_03470 [Anaerotruncus colihominis]
MKNQNYRLFLQTAANAVKKASQSERIPAFFALTSSAACKKSGDSYIIQASGEGGSIFMWDVNCEK